MVEKVITKKSFIGGRLVYPGEKVDVDAKGAVMPAASTPIGQMTVDQLRAALAAREADEAPPVFGGNVADPADVNTGSQEMRMAPVAPSAPSATQPQTVPPGAEFHNGGFIAPADDEAPAAVEEILPAGSISEQVAAPTPTRRKPKD
jgi:hypothetical protein